VSGRAVIVAAGRAERPHLFVAPTPDEEQTGPCPFCPGHEDLTPPETTRRGAGAPGTPGWRVRVFPNLYPIAGPPGSGAGAPGRHEVVVLSPLHDRSFATLDPEAAAEALAALRDRVRTHHDDGLAYAVGFVNHRRASGASVPHPHAQVVALDALPEAIHAAVDRFTSDIRLVVDDMADPELLVHDGEARAWCPKASTTPAMVRVALPDAGPRFDQASDDDVRMVAAGLRDALARLDAWLTDPPYNFVVHGGPPSGGPFHWYVEITPRVSITAGFERATGIFVNALAPEVVASGLRGACP